MKLGFECTVPNFSFERHLLGVAPQALQVIVLARLGGEDVDQIIAVIGQNPFGVFESFHADRIFAALVELRADLFADGLNLLGVGPAADHEEVGERGDFAQVKHTDVDRFFRFRGADCGKPGWDG